MKALAFALLLLVGAAHGQERRNLTPREVMDGKIPVQLHVADIPKDFKPARIVAVDSTNQFLNSSYLFSSLASYGAFSSVVPFLDLSWSAGETVNIAGTEFVVTYRPELGYIQSTDEPIRSRPTSISLRLSLVKAESVIRLEPVSELTKDDFLSAITDAKLQDSFSKTFLNSDPTTSMTAVARAAARPATLASTELSNIKQVTLAAIMYAADYDDVLPYVQGTDDFKTVVSPYMRSSEVFKTVNPNGGRYLFNMALAGTSQTDLESPNKTPMFYSSNAWPDGRYCVGYADGSAKFISAAEFQSLQPMFHLKLKRHGKPLPAGIASKFEVGAKNGGW